MRQSADCVIAGRGAFTLSQYDVSKGRARRPIRHETRICVTGVEPGADSAKGLRTGHAWIGIGDGTNKRTKRRQSVAPLRGTDDGLDRLSDAEGGNPTIIRLCCRICCS